MERDQQKPVGSRPLAISRSNNSRGKLLLTCGQASSGRLRVRPALNLTIHVKGGPHPTVLRELGTVRFGAEHMSTVRASDITRYQEMFLGKAIY